MTLWSPIAKQLKRDALLALAMLAVTLKIMVPAGFMPDAQPRNGLPFALVLCTGDGAKVVQPGEALGHGRGEDHGGKSVHDAPCPFAVQAAGAPPPSLFVVAGAGAVRYVVLPIPASPATAPGRGLAAPPPPPTGPPVFLI
ncbi:DUF2946 family protein [Caulobacter sp. CCH9-E1]|uniref:DUF2946 family protein n=1 Tax=Caulobacter sp. CCH9-E1 TaxID=1768768 RepID=UPI00083756C0|nr:DUF2946 family protein [Caulobacter sp. CCH9-E1]